MAENVTTESELEECRAKIIALTYELTRAYAEAKECGLAVRQLPTDARFQAACAAIQGMLAYSAIDGNGNWNNNSKPGGVAEQAVAYADALIAALAADRSPT